MSNKINPLVEITPENEKDLREQFSREVGHTNNCISDTVHKMSEGYQQEAINQNIHPQEYLNTITIEIFDKQIRKLLLEKPCICGRTKHLN